MLSKKSERLKPVECMCFCLRKEFSEPGTKSYIRVNSSWTVYFLSELLQWGQYLRIIHSGVESDSEGNNKAIYLFEMF